MEISGKTNIGIAVKDREEDRSYTTEETFGTRGAMKVSWPPRHILVPLDGEQEGKRVVPYVTALAKSHNAKVTLFTVARPFQWSLATPSVPAPTTAALKSKLIPFVMQMRTEDIDVDFEILRGDTKKVMKELIDSTDADLVILANRYRYSWLRFLKGKNLIPIMDRLKVPTIII